MSHLSGEVKRLLGLITRYDQDNYPEMLGHVCVINAPYIFQVIWKVVNTMLDPRTQHKIEVRARCVCGGGAAPCVATREGVWVGREGRGSSMRGTGSQARRDGWAVRGDVRV